MLETSLIFVQNFWQELLIGISMLMFITGISLKMSENMDEPVKLSKREWIELKRLG